MTYVIAKHPNTLSLRVEKNWDGTACPDDRLWAEIHLSQSSEGIHVHVRGPMLHEQRVPDAPIGSRVEGLWEFDVIEIFLVGPGHQYLELELGAGGHWLLLGFDRIRNRENSFETFEPIVKFKKHEDKTWTSELVLPWSVIPENLRALNGFAIMSGQFLSLEPLPGKEADFHQPDFYPSATL